MPARCPGILPQALPARSPGGTHPGRAGPFGQTKELYEPLLGTALAEKHTRSIHQVIPQCSLFLCGTIYKELVDSQKKDPKEIPFILEAEGIELIRSHLVHIVDYAQGNTDKADKSWPVLLKSNAFFNHVVAHLSGIAKGRATSREVVT
jgi:hypothetical protein